MAPIRAELFSIERLEQHAESLAHAQTVTQSPKSVMSLQSRLDENAKALLKAYRASANAVEAEDEIVPAAEWLLDNYHVIEEQIWEIRSDLPQSYYKQLPKLDSGPFSGYPRVFGIAWAFVAHTDSHFTPEALRSFLRSYQRVQPLTIGELWAVAITLRIVLIENLRRLSKQIIDAHLLREEANELADRMLGVNGHAQETMADVLAPYDRKSLPVILAAQLSRRFRDPDPKIAPIQEWLERRLEQDNLTIDEAVHLAQQRQGASNVTVQNVVTSMRLISNTDWSELFESVSLVDECLRHACSFRKMDFSTRNLYRSAIEVLARGSKLKELEIAERALACAEEAREKGEEKRKQDPGYYLVSKGRYEFERLINFKPPFGKWFYRSAIARGVRSYVTSVHVVMLVILAGILALVWRSDLNLIYLPLLLVIGLIPVSEAAVFIVNQLAIRLYKPRKLPAFNLGDFIPEHLRTMVVVPTLLLNKADVLEQVEQLEVHHLASPDGHVTYALLSDWQDSDQEITDQDKELLETAQKAVEALNEKYGPSASGRRFLILHRRRLFNESENTWMGWERKRGKLSELNRLLRGDTETTFLPDADVNRVPENVRFVITLDADTRLPLGTVSKLIGKMAHPLNQPKFDKNLQRITEGYAIMQPRVTPSLPTQSESTLFQQVFSSPGGLDPYSSAVSDVYQDMFGEGTYTGKGIYDVDAFEASLEGRIPENTLLSHDLFESIFARAAYVSDIEFIEDFPSRYDVANKRAHRWARGDWQLLPWALRLTKRGFGGVARLGRWKMMDNLRRAMLAPMTFIAFIASWFLPPNAAFYWLLSLVLMMAVPSLVPVFISATSRLRGITRRSRFTVIANDLKIAGLLVLLNITFLADQAWLMGDAFFRTIYRLFISRKNMLEWVTSAQAGSRPRLTLFGFYRSMSGGVVLVVLALLLAVAFGQAAWLEILPLAILWLAAPAIASLISKRPKARNRVEITQEDKNELRIIARKTWRYFETFVTADDNMLPPDNFQEDPEPILARRTSPTNISLYFLSAVSARDFGWTSTLRAVERFESTFETLKKLEKFKGHFYNWYDTSNLDVLQPPYVSSVDSGNFGGHLIALAQACEEWAEMPIKREVVMTGISDNLSLLKDALEAIGSEIGDKSNKVDEYLRQIEERLSFILNEEDKPLEDTLFSLEILCAELVLHIETVISKIRSLSAADVLFWAKAVLTSVEEHHKDILYLRDAPQSVRRRLRKIATRARKLALDMDFSFLVDKKRKLLSIGYSVPQNSLDNNCYDLLASEARLASFFAIAKGDVPARHWFRLGRTGAPVGKGAALISWSGSMFEYLMPALVMREPIGSLLDRTNNLVVDCQEAYGTKIGTPWGISESAYNARDIEFTYQYSNFGIPDLGLKRGLSDNHVIAPYATGLASMYDPHKVIENYRRLKDIGACGRYGYYDAVDFTKARLLEGIEFEIVYNYMAHHQGMTIVAIANTLMNKCMQERFHAEPIIHASELLLQERTPRHVTAPPQRAEEYNVAAAKLKVGAATVRRLTAVRGTSPATHLMSNGSYSVMLTSAGSGVSKWNGMTVTRWREDASRDDWGSYIFLKDIETKEVWSAGQQPTGTIPDQYEVLFSEDRAEFSRRDGNLTTAMDVLVSAESPSEVRRITLSNSGSETRMIELTSYMELVLASSDSDIAHPAFSKMFVQTEYLQEYGALIATRRPRAANDPELWAAHVAFISGDHLREPTEYETDRARFLGRGRTIRSPEAIWEEGKLSNSTGTVLDPVFSLRHRVEVEPGRTTRISFWTFVASSRDELINLIDTHRSPGSYERAMTLAWTQAQLQLRHLDIGAREAADFQRLAGHVIFADPRLRPSSDIIKLGLGPQNGLWSQGISGDLPIVAIRIDDLEDMEVVRQLIRAHEYWNLKGLSVDLVIINERSASYLQDLQNAIEAVARASRPRLIINGRAIGGSIYTLRSDLMSVETRNLVNSVARIVLTARRGLLADQFARLDTAPPVKLLPPYRYNSSAERIELSEELEFFNGFGGFADNGREYVITFESKKQTPTPWINVIANDGFGFHVSAEGAGYTWAVNSRDYQLTPWSNDPVSNAAGECLYIRDEKTGDIFCPTAAPLRDRGNYIARHGRGYSRFEHRAFGIHMDTLQFVPVTDHVKITRLKLKNLSGQPRELSITAYLEWVLGSSRGAVAPYIVTEIEPETQAFLARNPWSIPFGTRVSFFDMLGQQTAWTGDRREFLGRNGRLAYPAVLQEKEPLSGNTGAGYDPCAAIQQKIELAPEETKEIIVLLGDAESVDEAKALVEKYRSINFDSLLNEVKEYWDKILTAIQIRTPDRAMDIMINHWLLYQTQACRITARSAFYQASGAYGFRDQLQDGMAMTFTLPEQTRQHLIRAAGRQFPEGDVQHWWLPHSGQGVRTRISDDRVWLSYGVATYIRATGDESILDEQIPFIEGQQLGEGEHDAFFFPLQSEEVASLFEHCARGLDQCVKLTGSHGLPLIGTGDWNDGMNRVGELGKGESIWLGWLFVKTVELIAPFAEKRDPDRLNTWRVHSAMVAAAIEQYGWDGEWYRRGYFDDGTPFGSSGSDECQIDAIAQTWAVLSGGAKPERAHKAMRAMERYLVRYEDGISLLFTPPFDKTSRDPGYIKGYPPGLRENGGQYSHAAMWGIIAFAEMGKGDTAGRLFSLLNPINHAKNDEEVARYKVEPYVVAADVYSEAPHIGRGGWTWYTGSAGWMYRAGVESIIGLKQQDGHLTIEPCIPTYWPSFSCRVHIADTTYEIEVSNDASVNKGISKALLNGKVQKIEKSGRLILLLDGKAHKLEISLGKKGSGSRKSE
ncbi:glucoamylase family protein [Microvirga sp. W0021]|uniref:Glucoamylase family protein n=1 Tax=Hohaiivirga grylli TaxID=3133970 RepID=A0ABV0BI10_9HYPH